MASTINVAGQRFGRLVAKTPTHRPKNNRLEWLCDCDCGNTTTLRSDRLRSGETKSCGCLQRSHRLLNGSLGSFREWLRKYKSGAKCRNIVFELSEVQFLLLTSMECYYCGSVPISYYGAGRQTAPVPYICNGIDRIDNSKGYSFENCAPCCGLCNRMKMDTNEHTFIAQCRMIADRVL